MSMRSVLFFAVCTVVLSLSGCEGAFDPYDRPGEWSMTNASNETIAQQVANKQDLLHGQSETGASGVAAVAGIEKATNGGTATGLQTAATPVSSASQ